MLWEQTDTDFIVGDCLVSNEKKKEEKKRRKGILDFHQTQPDGDVKMQRLCRTTVPYIGAGLIISVR